jgi:hypothetical protein
MGWITLRQFAWTERPSLVDSYPEVADIHRVAVDRWLLVDLSHAVGVNALVAPASGPVRYETRQHELRLMLCYLQSEQDGQVRLRDNTFRASAVHIRRFVSEAIGFGMLVAAVQAAYQWQEGTVAYLDALPTMLAGPHNVTKARPDMLFTTPGLILAGEARGRSEPPPGRGSAQPRERLDSLLPWSHHHGTHPLAMTWCYTTGLGVTVDLYTRSGRLPGMTGPVGQPETSPMPVQPELFDQDELTVTAVRAGPQRGNGKARDFDRRSPSELAAVIARRVEDVADQLYETAPQAPVRIADQEVRGSWAKLDLLGEATGSFLLALLEHPVSGEQGRAVMERLRERGLSALVSGRLVVAISEDAEDQPWHHVAD